MMGGGGIIGPFLDAGAIDELIISVIPTLIGEGIPLISPRRRTVPLQLLSVKKFSDGVVRLHYAVSDARPSGRASTRKTSVPSA
jgi:dihydrofolate reductase